MLLAISWAAFGIVAWIKKDDFKPASDHISLALAIMMCQVVPFFAAIGALLGQTWRWTLVGLALFALYAALLLVAIHTYGV
jgi:hypothetical protein